MIPLPGVTSVTRTTAKLPLKKPLPRKHWEDQKSAGNFHGELAKEMLSQLDSNGKISLKNLHLEDDDFSELSNRLNPKVRQTEGVLLND